MSERKDQSMTKGEGVKAPFPPGGKYRPFPPVELDDRRWPGRTATKPPLWCSVDLRDGNQALKTPIWHHYGYINNKIITAKNFFWNYQLLI